jgi:hypothetical protein
MHSKNVALVLDWKTRLVSLQFHIKCDPSFHTVTQDYFDSKWQEKAGLLKQEEEVKQKKQSKTSKRKKSIENQPPAPIIPVSEGGHVGNSEGVAIILHSEGAGSIHAPPVTVQK